MLAIGSNCLFFPRILSLKCCAVSGKYSRMWSVLYEINNLKKEPLCSMIHCRRGSDAPTIVLVPYLGIDWPIMISYCAFLLFIGLTTVYDKHDI